MCKDIKKMTKCKARLYLRNQGIRKRRAELIADGYAIGVANSIIVKEFKLNSIAPIYQAIKQDD